MRVLGCLHPEHFQAALDGLREQLEPFEHIRDTRLEVSVADAFEEDRSPAACFAKDDVRRPGRFAEWWAEFRMF